MESTSGKVDLWEHSTAAASFHIHSQSTQTASHGHIRVKNQMKTHRSASSPSPDLKLRAFARSRCLRMPPRCSGGSPAALPRSTADVFGSSSVLLRFLFVEVTCLPSCDGWRRARAKRRAGKMARSWYAFKEFRHFQTWGFVLIVGW